MKSCRYCVNVYAIRETFYRFPLLRCRQLNETIFISPDASKMTQEDIACENKAKDCEHWEMKGNKS